MQGADNVKLNRGDYGRQMWGADNVKLNRGDFGRQMQGADNVKLTEVMIMVDRLRALTMRNSHYRGGFSKQTQGVDSMKLTEVIMVDRHMGLTMWNSQRWFW